MRGTLCLFVLLAACGGDDGPGPIEDAGTEDSGGRDAAIEDSGPGDDAGGGDAGMACGSDTECDDGVFCNGAETCTDGACAAGMLACDDGIACTVDACNEPGRTCLHAAPDADGDGHEDAACADGSGAPLGDDCDDADPLRNPGAAEDCDDADEDCDPATFGARDLDADGAIDARCCNGPTCGLDCDDTAATVHPGSSESCDGTDNDCDALIDEGLPRPFYRDADGDGFGTDSDTVTGMCAPPLGYVLTGGDCDDADPLRNPGAPEACDMRDNDCNGLVDDATMVVPWYVDADGDLHGDPASTPVDSCAPIMGRVTSSDDCDDSAAGRHPGAPEVCNGIDDDCDAMTDEGVLLTFHRDTDGDGFGSPAGPTAAACTAPSGFAANRTDCDDADPAANPGAPEVCDGGDNDCDVAIDEGVTRTFWRDADGDGFGNPAGPTVMRCAVIAGYSATATDCDDTLPGRNPGAPEVCDGVDNDCDTVVDDGVLLTFYRDGDGDGFGSPAGPTREACTAPMGYVTGTTDCDDSRAAVNPAAPEVCDGLDNDCDGSSDEGVLSTFYRDVDGDGFGNLAGGTVTACSAPPGYAATNTDCDDGNAARNPAAPEVCDGVDNDCDLMVDEGVRSTFYRDADGDGFGSATGGTTMACAAPPGYSANNLDCDDGNRARNPATSELCDGIDNDCDGMVDEAGIRTFYRDFDGDGWGDVGSPIMTMSCTPPAGYVAASGDCLDSNALVYPGAPEVCNRRDDDCSLPGMSAGGLDVAEDRDNDMHAPSTGATCMGGFPRDDCNDLQALTYPGAFETCDGLDNDCSSGGGLVPAEDMDGDGHSAPAAACSGGFLRDDCRDMDDTIYGGAPELCDRIDNDCSTGGAAEPMEDADSDGYAAPTAMCGGGPLPKTDCDDASATAYPGAPETAPRPLGPMNGELTGSVHAAARGTLRPTFRWARQAARNCRATFEVQADDSCTTPGFASCGFASPEVSGTAMDTTSFRPAADMPASFMAPVGRRYYWRVRLCDGPTCTAWSAVRYADVGRVANDYNGDGYSDVLVSSPTYSSGTYDIGRVSAYYGSPSGIPTSASVSLYTTSSLSTDGQDFGASLASGDLNADGFADLVVGAPGYLGAGAVYLYYGAASGFPPGPCTPPLCSPAAPVRITESTSGFRYGSPVSCPGDLDADGYADVAVGVPLYGSAPCEDCGRVYIYRGGLAGIASPAWRLLSSPATTAFQNFGRGLTHQGDVDGDGYADLVVGEEGRDGGYAYLFRGSGSGLGATPSVTLANPGDDTMGGERTDAGFGFGVALGDANGDGYSDLAVGAYDQDSPAIDEGTVFLYTGRPSGLPSAPTQTLDCPTHQMGASFGERLAFGDVNGDGIPDLTVAADDWDGAAIGEGAVFIYHGATAGFPATPTATRLHPTGRSSGNFGQGLAAGGDSNGDGYYDMTTGYDSGTNEFAAVYRGGSAGVAAAMTVELMRSGSTPDGFGDVVR